MARLHGQNAAGCDVGLSVTGSFVLAGPDIVEPTVQLLYQSEQPIRRRLMYG